MAPYRNHVEARSSRKPVRQYVSETHDHKPDAPIRTAVLRLDQIKALVDQASKYPDRSIKKAVLLREAARLRTKQLKSEIRASRRRKSA
jgi:hypothetical protein